MYIASKQITTPASTVTHYKGAFNIRREFDRNASIVEFGIIFSRGKPTNLKGKQKYRGAYCSQVCYYAMSQREKCALVAAICEAQKI